MKVYEIIPGKLYQRGSFSHVQDKQGELDALGIKTVVNVRTKEDDDLRRLSGIVYMHRPIKDGIPDKWFIKDTADVVVRHVRFGNPVLVYCNAGRNRSSLVNALAIMQLLDYNGQQALEHIKAIRPGAFGSNQHFAEWLESI